MCRRLSHRWALTWLILGSYPTLCAGRRLILQRSFASSPSTSHRSCNAIFAASPHLSVSSWMGISKLPNDYLPPRSWSTEYHGFWWEYSMTSAVEYQVVLSIGSEQMEGSYSFRGTVKVF
jgi:hypothetical protein